MIDVVFMLLIFFVWTASFHVAELILPSTLVTEDQTQGNQVLDPTLEDLERIIVRIQGGRSNSPLSWHINDVSVLSLHDVRERLSTIANIKNDLPVLVDPDASVRLGDVIDVYDAAKIAGFPNVQFATPAE